MAGRATIVGAAGFVGRRLYARLQADGWEVFAPAKRDPALFRGELGTVFYCAGLTADYDARPFDTVEAHATLVSELARAAGFEKLIYLSSTRLYDGQSGDVLEDAPLVLDPADPRRIYDLSKALGENVTLTRTGGRGAVARLSNVYDWSPDAPGFLSQWLIRAGAEREIRLESSPHVRRDYIHLDDVVRALIAMAEAPAPGIVNVAAGALASNAEVAEVFEDRGWKIAFAGDADPPPPPNASARKLTALGVTPRPVKDVVARHLEDLGA